MIKSTTDFSIPSDSSYGVTEGQVNGQYDISTPGYEFRE